MNAKTPTRRITALWLPHLAIQRLTRTKSTDSLPDDTPFSLIETDAKGMRIFAANASADKAGIKSTMRLSDARAICHQLQVRQHNPKADSNELSKIARWLERYSPSIQTYGTDMILLDTTGCDHLHGGEALMLSDIQHRLNHIGYTIRLGLADTIGAAFALTRYSQATITISPKGQLHQSLAFLPVRALRLDQEQADSLYNLGLKTIGQLFDIPRASLARRFAGIKDGASLLKRLGQATGSCHEPLTPYRQPPALRFTLAPVEPCLHHEGLKGIFDLLLDRLLIALERQNQGLRKLSFRCFYTDGGEKLLSASFAKPCRVRKHIEILFSDQLLNIDPRFGIDGFVMSGDLTDKTQHHQNNLLETSSDQIGKLSELIDRLINRFGKSAVFQVENYESHLPEKAQTRALSNSIPLVIPAQAGIQGHTTNASRVALDSRLRGNDGLAAMQDNCSHRPITIFTHPEIIDVIAEIPEGPPMRFRWRRVLHQVTKARGPERIAPQWWSSGQQQIRDYYEVEDTNGQRYWLFRTGFYNDPTPGPAPNWRIHGLFL